MLSGFAAVHFEALRKEMSYLAPGKKMKREYVTVLVNGRKRVTSVSKPVFERKYLLSVRGEFPTGLLYILKRYVKKLGLAALFEDARQRPRPSPGMFQLNLE